MIIFWSVNTIFICAFFNSFGISVTKYGSAAQRATIDAARTASIWLLSLALGLETFVPLQIPGFALLVFGTLLYNEILILPCGGFDQWTKDAIAQRKAESGELAANGYKQVGFGDFVGDNLRAS